MAENKKSFLLYCDLIHTVDKMPDDKAGLLFKHILKYVNDLDPETEDLIIQLTFEPVKQQLKRDLKSWELERQQRSNAGKKGMEKRWSKQNIDNQINKEITNDNTVITKDNSVINAITEITDTVNVTVTDTVKVKEKHIFDFFEDFEKCILRDTDVEVFKTICNEYILSHKRVQQLSEPLTSFDLYRLINKYGKISTLKILDNMENYKPLLTKSVSAYKTANNWLGKDKK